MIQYKAVHNILSSNSNLFTQPFVINNLFVYKYNIVVKKDAGS